MNRTCLLLDVTYDKVLLPSLLTLALGVSKRMGNRKEAKEMLFKEKHSVLSQTRT